MPGDVTLSHTNLYRVRVGQPVQVDVVIGDGQAGGTALTVFGAPVPFDNVLGVGIIGQPGQNLVSSVLQCVTTVQDINPATNHTSVTYRLSGGVTTQIFPFAMQVSGDSGLAHYIITFLFTS